MAMVCHNCGASMLFPRFLKQEFPDVYQEYVLEEFKKGKVGKQGSKVSAKDFHTTVDLNERFSIPEHTERLSNLDANHPAAAYLNQRMIPHEHFAHLFYTDNFQQFLSEFDAAEDAPTTPRIIIPFYDSNFNLKGFQGRAMPWNVKEIRYITIKLDESFPKVFGIHRLNNTYETVYVTEGPFDSLFLPNAIAMMGADLSHKTIVDLVGQKKIIYVYDNEPRSKEIQKRMQSRIENGQSVAIWPNWVKHKDINDMIIHGLTLQKIRDILYNNTHSGMKAKLVFGQWRK